MPTAIIRQAAFVLLWLFLAGVASASDRQVRETFDKLGIQVTGGAAPGYVNDAACAYCHKESQSYRQVAMARSFYRPSADKVIEDLQNNHYHHLPSDRHYELSLRDGDYWFKRYQLDPAGQPINVFETKVDWILGSGYHVRTYLYQTEIGELYQLPLAWYTLEGKWGMQPGYDKPDHQGVLRPVRRECMFCHNAYPDVPEGSDAHLEPHVFPHELPEGTGCQRCHGPGAEHVRLVFGGETDQARIRESIANPGRLSPQRRDDVCFECHMLPAVAATPIRRFERKDYSFRPGQDLADYQVTYEIRENDQDPAERFEINHHPYRLLQSRCYQESRGRMSCLSCHDPHVKIRPEQRAAHYRPKCLACHQGLQHPGQEGIAQGDCTECHMPTSRPQDVVNVAMTDHKIRILKPGEEPMRKKVEIEHELQDIQFYQPQRAPDGDLGEIYRLLGLIRPNLGISKAALGYLEKLLRRSPPGSRIPYHDLVRSLVKRKDLQSADRVLDMLEQRHGANAESLRWRGLVKMMRQQT